MGPLSPAFVDDAFRRNNRDRLILRVVVIIGLMIYCLIFDQVGQNRYSLAVCLGLLVVVTLEFHRRVPGERLPIVLPWYDVLAVGSLVWMVPDVWTAGLVLVVASPIASGSVIGRARYLAVESTGLVVLGLDASLSGADAWLVPFAVAVLLMPVIASYVDVFSAHERMASEHLAELLGSSAVLFWDVDADTGQLLSAEGRAEEILGWSAAEFKGRDVTTLIHPEDLVLAARAVRLADGATTFHQARLRHRDGHYVWLRHNIRMHHESRRRVLRGVAVDITELVDAHEETRRRAEHDELTGLFNRAKFLEVVSTALRTGEPAALLLLDLDRFKQVNDTLGHHAGDTLLSVIAGRIVDVVGSSATVARLGGDEFAVFTRAPGVQAVMELCERISAACEESVDLDGLECAGSASIGVVLAPLHGNEPITLLRRADVAMYAAKRRGASSHVFDFRTDEVSVERLALSSELEHATAAGDLRLWFQPKVDLATGEIRGVEGLLRWHHPRRGVLTPAEFLDVSELSRHMPAITRSVVRQGLEMAKAAAALGRRLEVAVNVSIRNLLEHDFVTFVRDAIRDAGVDAALLTLEVTEREIMDDRGGHRIDTEAIRELGIGLAVDDFGTGHSSLVRIQHLPVTELKIDRRFVGDLGTDPSVPILVRSIVDLGRNLGHTIVAEGVETRAELEALREMGCNLAQGFLFSAALPAAELLYLLAGQGVEERSVSSIG